MDTGSPRCLVIAAVSFIPKHTLRLLNRAPISAHSRQTVRGAPLVRRAVERKAVGEAETEGLTAGLGPALPQGGELGAT